MTGRAGAFGRVGRAAFDLQASGRFGASLGNGEREQERSRESETGKFRSLAVIDAIRPEGDSRRD